MPTQIYQRYFKLNMPNWNSVSSHKPISFCCGSSFWLPDQYPASHSSYISEAHLCFYFSHACILHIFYWCGLLSYALNIPTLPWSCYYLTSANMFYCLEYGNALQPVSSAFTPGTITLANLSQCSSKSFLKITIWSYYLLVHVILVHLQLQ